ncbi:uncharacterized protein GGS22DRAFT_199028 [Annulohypoxylon maeteangense]|uniref:uncharacterized protein n=1 Tax=Annulohypoxylon maeteangense TaxID=1927788 RepID=UPI00200797C2|nr:uncharacterized protein GGS22DRAFT_199028 [Annulohypoxylon maeteangense]KAI0886628.1 hypothetical protein GGS22DRAFT_199028 [Annulohypoxylon maeteangense]
MLDDLLSSSYGRYKHDTNVFVTWLGRTAQACGYKPNAHDSRDATSVKYSVSTKELGAQIDAISRSSVKIPMPDTIKIYLTLAIEARQRCSDWYESTSPQYVAEAYDQDGHRFFIKVLQDALTRLGGGDTRDTADKPTIKNCSGKYKNITQTSNRFSHLSVDDVDDSSQFSQIDAARDSSKKKSDPKPIDAFELERGNLLEKAFALFCFFEDMNRIHKKLKETWKQCASGSVDLLTATVVTNASVCTIRKAEKELCSTFFPHISDDDCYAELAGMMIMMHNITKGIDPMTGPGVDVTPSDGFIFLPTARIMLKFILLADNTKTWPPPIVPLKYNYVNNEHKIDMPEHKKLQHDDQMLTQLLMDLELPDKIVEITSLPNLPSRFTTDYFRELAPLVSDVCLTTLRPVWTEKKLSVAAVLIAQTLLDIFDTCDDLSKFRKQVRCTNAYTCDSLNLKKLPDGFIITVGNLSWPPSIDEALYTIYKMQQHVEILGLATIKHLISQISEVPRFHTRTSVPDEFKWILEQNPDLKKDAAYDSMKINFIRPAKDDNFAIIHNPSQSGSFLLKLLISYQEVGLGLANWHMSIFGVAHIYNALRQLKMLDIEWPVMERIIELHKGALFADAIPTTTKDMNDRINYRLNQPRKRKDAWKFQEPHQTNMLRSMLDSDRSIDHILWDIEQQTEPKIDKQGSSQRQRQKQKLYPEDFIDKVQEVTSKTLNDMAIDYVRLTKHCRRLLEDFQRMWAIQIHVKPPAIRIKLSGSHEKKFARSHPHILTCLNALEEAKRVRDLGQYSYDPGDGDVKGKKGFIKDTKDPDRHGVGLLVASKVFRMSLLKEKNDFRFPLTMEDISDFVEPEEPHKNAPDVLYQLHHMETAEELRKLFSSTTYVIVNFFADFDKTHSELAPKLVDISYQKSIPGILAFARLNKADVPELVKEYCNGDMRWQTFAFFKDGKQVKVNGNSTVLGSEEKVLYEAIMKLRGLAKAKMIEQGRKDENPFPERLREFYSTRGRMLIPPELTSACRF